MKIQSVIRYSNIRIKVINKTRMYIILLKSDFFLFNASMIISAGKLHFWNIFIKNFTKFLKNIGKNLQKFGSV